MRNVLALSLISFPSALFGQPAITTAALPNPIIGRAVSGAVWSLNASGGAPPYTWAVAAGSLAAGLSLSPAGAITGTAFTAGAQTFTARVTDSASATATRTYTITAQYAIGHGCTTATVIDWDCDYYGVGSGIGPDADDNDPTVNTPASMIAKYGTLSSFLSTVKGYAPNNIWYLSTSGNDSTCTANDASLPCATIAQAESSSGTGDALVLRAGIWATSGSGATQYYIVKNGAPSKPHIVMAYPGELAIVDHSTIGGSGIAAQGQYVVVDGLKIQNTPCAGTANPCGIGVQFGDSSPQVIGVVVRNCEIQDYYRGIWIPAGQTGTLIEKNSIHDNYGEHNIYIAWNTGDYGTSSYNLTVRYNLLYNAAWDNFHNNGPCSGCLLDSNIMYSANMDAGGGSPNIQMNQGWNHSTVQNNIVFTASAWAMLFTDYDDSTGCCYPYNQNYNTIVSNTFVHTGRDASGQNLSTNAFSVIGVANNSAQTSPQLDLGNNTYANNVFLEGAAGGGANNAVMLYQQHQSSNLNWIATDTWTNNVLYASNGAAPLSIGVAGSLSFQNWTYFASNAKAFTGNLQSNPNLVAWNPLWYGSPGNFNLALLAGSPAANVGTATGAPTTDIRGNATSSPPNVGAYQYIGSRCDVNGDEVVNLLDVGIATAQALGTLPCTNAALDGSGTCDALSVQIVINAALGGSCAAQ